MEWPAADLTAALAGSGGASLATLASRRWRRCRALTSVRTRRRHSCRRRGAGARAWGCACIASACASCASVWLGVLCVVALQHREPGMAVAWGVATAKVRLPPQLASTQNKFACSRAARTLQIFFDINARQAGRSAPSRSAPWRGSSNGHASSLLSGQSLPPSSRQPLLQQHQRTSSTFHKTVRTSLDRSPPPFACAAPPPRPLHKTVRACAGPRGAPAFVASPPPGGDVHACPRLAVWHPPGQPSLAWQATCRFGRGLRTGATEFLVVPNLFAVSARDAGRTRGGGVRPVPRQHAQALAVRARLVD